MSTALSLPSEAAFALELVAKATLVLLATAAAAGVVAARGGSAAARHLVWTLGVCGVLALPLLAAALPAWRTPLLTVAAPPAAAPAPTPAPSVAMPAAASPATFTSTGRTGDAAAPRTPAPAAEPISRRSGGPLNGMGMGMAAAAAWLLGALACDDRVLQAGTRARDYASHLLEVARAFRPARLAGPVAVSMARPSQLEGRLLAVLDSVRDRRIPGRAAAAGASALALALLLPLAAVRPGSAQQTPVQHVTFGGPKPWKDTARVKPPRSPDAYPDYDAALRAGVQDLDIAARPGERLTLRVPDRVSVRVLPWDRPSVHVRVDDTGLHLAGENGPGGVNVTVTGAPRTHGPDPHVRIMAPRDFSVHTESYGGGLEIGALNGTFTGSMNGGGLAFRGTRGTVRMTARGGGAFIQHAHLDGRLEMDGGGVMMDGNSGNLDVTGAAATVHGSPGGTLRVDAPGNGSGDDAEVACTAGGACTIATGTADGRRTRTSVATGRGGNEVTVQAAGSGRARGTTVAAAGTPVPNSVTVYPTGRGEATTIRAVSSSDAVTTTVAVGSGGWARTTVTTDETTRGRDGYAYATGDVEGRIAAVRAMARNAPPDAAAEGLARLAYSDDDVRVQRAAVEELGKMRTRASLKQLGRISRRHPDARVRAQAAAAIR